MLGAMMIFLYSMNAGFFFSFSNTVIRSLKKLENGEDAMRTINREVLNLWFYLLFGGAVLISIFSILTLGIHRNSLIVIASLVYLLGCFMVTGLANVPLNALLEDQAITWDKFTVRWLQWNRVRVTSCIIASLIVVISAVY